LRFAEVIRETFETKKETVVSIQDAYNRWSATYDLDRNLTRDLDEAVTRQTLANLRCQSILELAGGTGKNTGLLAELGQRVYALDFSEGMLNKAKAKLPSGNVIFGVADISAPWPCKNQSIDLIVCNLVLEHIADLPFVFAEAFRTLIHGGRFFICELHPFRQYQGTQAQFQDQQGRTEIPAFVHHLSDYIHAANTNSLTLESLNEWWHEDDRDKPPRLLSLMLMKSRR
jgi:ubiquinone/menaquinone biosynthesis C-methylase UbiE